MYFYMFCSSQSQRILTSHTTLIFSSNIHVYIYTYVHMYTCIFTCLVSYRVNTCIFTCLVAHRVREFSRVTLHLFSLVIYMCIYEYIHMYTCIFICLVAHRVGEFSRVSSMGWLRSVGSSKS